MTIYKKTFDPFLLVERLIGITFFGGLRELLASVQKSSAHKSVAAPAASEVPAKATPTQTELEAKKTE